MSDIEIAEVARRIVASGEIWECGVYQGATAKVLSGVAKQTGRTLRLFDTFCGRPQKGPHDTGNSDTMFDDTSLEAAKTCVDDPGVCWHVGVIPQTFIGLEASKIAFAYLDLDLYRSTLDALAFVWPRLVRGGLIVVDDYNQPIVWPGVDIALVQSGLSIARVIGCGHKAVLEKTTF